MQLSSRRGWVVQDYEDLDIDVARGVVVREFPLAPGFGFADYLLYIDGEACGVPQAKRAGTPLIGVEMQSEKYSNGLPAHRSHRRTRLRPPRPHPCRAGDRAGGRPTS
ncbi:MAG: hypothetical protein ABI134_17070 [Byssovorax sp.]